MTVRLRQLDGIRGIAVILVIFHHWTDWGHAAGLGNIGVQLFFVLSGFLITGILLTSRDAIAKGETAMGPVLRRFQLDRVARIWPIYFLTLAAVAIAGSRFEHPEAMPWHAVYLSNLWFTMHGSFDSQLSHFWSLSVEAQFYILWPFAVLLLARRSLERLTLVLVLVAPLFRLAMVAAGFTDFAQFNTLPFANMDSLGMGALIAQWQRYDDAAAAARYRRLGRAALLAAAGFVTMRIAGVEIANLEQTLYAVAFAWVVLRGTTGFAGLPGRILSFRPLLWIGLVSYGIYVYHMFMPRIVGAVLRALAAPAFAQDGVIFFVLCAAATLILATISWLVVERPIIHWRRSLRTQRSAHGF